MGTVVTTKDLTATFIRDEFRDGLRSAASGAHAFTDPKAGSRPAGSEFILTSFPDRDPFYPLVVIEQADSPADRVDSQVELYENEFSAEIVIKAESATHMFQIRDQLVDWFQGQALELGQKGFHELHIPSSTPEPFNENSRVVGWNVTVAGLVYTAPS